MIDESNFEQVYQDYKDGKIELSEVSGVTLLRINRRLDEELEEKMRAFCELEKLIYGETFVEDPKRKPPKLF